MHPWHHYVALGDSFTEGVGDPVEGFATLGAADRIAAALRQTNPDLRYSNLAQRGLCVAEIRERQLEAALRLQPDLVSIVAGANDIMTGQFSAARWEQEFATLYGAFVQSGAAVIAGNVPDFPVLRTLKEPLQARIRGNIARGNAVIQRLAAQYQVILVDAWALSQRSDPEGWSEDGVHLNARGYFKFAGEILQIVEQHTGFALSPIGESGAIGAGAPA
jgi:lysophospholipase L1-like esterase